MRHPLLLSQPEKRKRMVSLLSSALRINRAGNLIFVCGGNKDEHLRPKFCEFARPKLADFVIFQPEYAIIEYMSDNIGIQLDLGVFEELIAELSHAIIIFPEAPGSFAETGYFSKILDISEKTILVANANFQKDDSFIMLGPGKLYETNSRFRPCIQLNYEDPDFSIITEKVTKFQKSKTKKIVNPTDNPSAFDLFCLIYKIVDLLRIATIDDVIFVIRAVTKGQKYDRKAKQLFAILAGCEYIKEIGDYGHFYCLNFDEDIVGIKEGLKEEEFEVRLEISNIIRNHDADFSKILEDAANAN